MIANNLTTEEDKGHSLQALSIEKACEEYNSSVKLTLEQINHQLDEVLLKNTNGLDELAVKIAARTNFLEKNPSFLSCLVYDKKCVKCEQLMEFDDIRITLKEHCKRIQEKLKEIETYHNKLLQLVMKNGRGQRVLDDIEQRTQCEEDEYEDCLEKVNDTPEETKSSCIQIEPEIEVTKPSYTEVTKPSETEVTKTPESSTESFKKLNVKRGEEIKITFPVKTNFDKSQNEFDKVTIAKNAFSEIDLSKDSPVKSYLFPDVVPDVQRRRPFENLHGKLIQQLVATDSLEGFLKLMKRKPTKQSKKNPDLESKYTGSLWFFAKDVKKGKPSTPRKSRSQKSTKTEAGHSNLVEAVTQPVSMTNQCKTRKVKLGLSKNKLKYYDLLDDLDHSDLKPIQSEYPRRDNVPIPLHEAKTYLHRMMEENDKVWKNLLHPSEKKKKVSSPEKKKLSPIKAKQVKNLMEYLTAPEQKLYNPQPQTLIVMPVKIIYDNFPTRENAETPRGAFTDLTKTMEGKSLNAVFPIQRRKEMLDQLKGLKLRNDNIQKNIQKAIDVIETKMIDLLSSPNNATSSDAFNAMEKEITHVLKMMSESETEKAREMKVEPEKDETPKLKRGIAIVKKPETEVRKRDRSSDSKKGDEEKKSKQERDRSCEPKNPKAEVKKTSAKLDNINVKIAPLPKADDKIVKPKEKDAKKIANIEDGERLLGQVDTVIKKIDSIYNRFHEEKPKPVAKLDEAPETMEIKTLDYKFYETTPQFYVEPITFYQWRVYYTPHIEYRPIAARPKIREGVLKAESPKSRLPLKRVRHDSTLRTFYTLFFSSVFIALNFDYTS